jgi:hypothetical protein
MAAHRHGDEVTLDELRAANPELGMALYALEPGGPVTFEIYAPDGKVFSWRDATAALAIAQAFPPEQPEPLEPEPEPETAPETPGLFD